MPSSRTIAVLLTLAALLCAGSTKTTHWHFHGHSSIRATSSKSDCCSVMPDTGHRHASSEATSDSDYFPRVEADLAHVGDHCSVCDFLAGHVYGLASAYGYAGTLADCRWLSELLIDSPTGQERWVSCRGPPLVA